MIQERNMLIPRSTVEFAFIEGQHAFYSSLPTAETKKISAIFDLGKKRKAYRKDEACLKASFVLPQLFVNLLSKPDSSITLITLHEDGVLLFTGNTDGIFFKLFKKGGILLKTGFFPQEGSAIDLKSLSVGIYLLIIIRGDKERCAYKIEKG